MLRRFYHGRGPLMKPAGERPPYLFLAIVATMLAVYLTHQAPPQLGAAEILRDGPSQAAPYRKPDLADLLAGRACIPMKYLLENRAPEPVHSYSRPIACGGTQ
jgi:hypothetical protein